MTTWIGRIGGMVPTPCVSALSTSHEERATFGGGEGTLSPRRVRIHGVGARTWAAQLTGKQFAQRAEIVSLARRQALFGGSYRVIPCDAVDHNMFTPRASEELWDWTGLSVGTVQSFPSISTGEAFPMMMGQVAVNRTAWSPRVPLVKRELLYLSAYVEGVTLLRVRGRNAAGAISWQAQATFSYPSGTLQRAKFNRVPAEDVVSVEFAVEPAEEHAVSFAWPSIAYADNPYVPGEGCDSAYLSMPDRAIQTTLRGGREDIGYQIVEVGQ